MVGLVRRGRTELYRSEYNSKGLKTRVTDPLGARLIRPPTSGAAPSPPPYDVKKLFLTPAGQLYNALAKNPVAYRLSKVEWETTIFSDFSVGVVVRGTWTAETETLFLRGFEYDSSNVPAYGIESIAFGARVLGGAKKMLTIPAQDDPSEKRFLGFLIPPLKPPDWTRVETSYKWPRGAIKLERAGVVEEQSLTIPGSVSAGVDVDVSVIFKDGNIRYSIEETFEAQEKEFQGTTVYRAKALGIAAGKKLALQIRRLE